MNSQAKQKVQMQTIDKSDKCRWGLGVCLMFTTQFNTVQLWLNQRQPEVEPKMQHSAAKSASPGLYKSKAAPKKNDFLDKSGR